MASWLYHYLYLDFYVPLWPNIAASAVVYVLVAARIRALRKVHEELLALHASHRLELARVRDRADVAGVMTEVGKIREDFHQVISTLNALHGPGGAGGDGRGGKT